MIDKCIALNLYKLLRWGCQTTCAGYMGSNLTRKLVLSLVCELNLILRGTGRFLKWLLLGWYLGYFILQVSLFIVMNIFSQWCMDNNHRCLQTEPVAQLSYCLNIRWSVISVYCFSINFMICYLLFKCFNSLLCVLNLIFYSPGSLERRSNILSM